MREQAKDPRAVPQDQNVHLPQQDTRRHRVPVASCLIRLPPPVSEEEVYHGSGVPLCPLH